ncbi:MAG TPA: HNH endonuclease signature motif containing protein [Bosea sp. (in: a-proteobacteria)]|nr:HNH endonuclease signature motif containing protein [Bosea sp. (in: a-proteobacteria)]
MPYRPPVFRPSIGLGSDADRAAGAREYEARRGSARQRGYDARWDRERSVFLQLNPLCLGCQARGETTIATVVDHVIPHKGDMALFWDVSNWQPACSWDHDVIKQKLEAMWSKGEIEIADLRLDGPMARRIAPPLRCL